jgi:hypothetical protein
MGELALSTLKKRIDVISALLTDASWGLTFAGLPALLQFIFQIAPSQVHSRDDRITGSCIAFCPSTSI